MREEMGRDDEVAPGGAEPSTPGAHEPCCSSHGVDMDCKRYRRTHFVEVRPCCSADARLLEQETARREAMLAHRAGLLEQHPEIRLARELGPLMGDHEREYWIWTVEAMERKISVLQGPKYTEVVRG